MATSEVASSATGNASATVATGATASGGGGLSFRTFLSDVNPLQYIPVVGAVYRAVTGDEGNSTLRFVASLGTSFALGGPLGLGVTVAEKVTGIDPERIVRSLLSRVLHHGSAQATATPGAAGIDATAGATAGAATTGTTTPSTPKAVADMADRPWSAAELSAYAAATGGLSGTGTGTNAGTGMGAGTGGGGAVSADMLNAMELQRVNVLYA